MRDLNYQLKALCRRNCDGSFATQAKRERLLSRMATQLHLLGYRHLRAQSLKPKHVEALVQHWRDEGLSVGTCKNQMAALRWWAEKVDRQNVVARSNDHYGIPHRVLVAQVSKARELSVAQLARIPDPYVRASLELQRAFGLRREEAIKFNPHYADRGDKIVLKPTWTKGGRARVIPVLSRGQRDALNRAHRVARGGSLIPSTLTYRKQLNKYERQAATAGLSKMHGLRHAYAQSRYEKLTGWNAPVAGGPARSTLDAEARLIDRQARQVVSRELGHERIEASSHYLGH